MLDSPCLTGRCAYIFLSWDPTKTLGLQKLCREDLRLDNLPVSWNSGQKLQLLPNQWGQLWDTASPTYLLAVFMHNDVDKLCPNRATLTGLLRTPSAWVKVTLSHHESVGKVVVRLFGTLLFGFGFPSICCESCAWESDFFACLGTLTVFVAGTSPWAKTPVVLLL